jgi:hypothetical protein
MLPPAPTPFRWSAEAAAVGNFDVQTHRSSSATVWRLQHGSAFVRGTSDILNAHKNTCRIGWPKATGRVMVIRRNVFARLSQALGMGLLASGSANAQAPTRKSLKILMRSSWGTDDATRASFPFAHGLALADAGHEVQIFLTGEATYLMRKATAAAILPIGWPPLSELRDKVVAKHIPVFS